MLNGLDTYGVTLHNITPEIDQGDIISFQTIEKEPGSSHLMLSIKAAIKGIDLLFEYVKKLEYGKNTSNFSRTKRN